jgi:hypothetical protein
LPSLFQEIAWELAGSSGSLTVYIEDGEQFADEGWGIPFVVVSASSFSHRELWFRVLINQEFDAHLAHIIYLRL